MWGLNKKQLKEMDDLRKKHDGVVTPEVLVRHARKKTSALHSLFEWDRTKGWEQYLLIQARMVLRVSVTIIEEDVEPVRMFVSLSTDRGTDGYRGMVDVLSNEDHRQIMLGDALAELKMFQRKYSALTELSKIFMAIKSVGNPRPRKKRKKTA